MKCRHSVKGLEKHEIFTTDTETSTEIRLEINGGSILIGKMSQLLEQEPYKDGTFTDENGIVIHLKNFMNNMAITQNMKKNIMRSKREKESPERIFTERMSRFHGILFNRLRGEIRKE